MRILLTGRNGQLGWELERALAALGEVFAFDRAGLDLALPDQIVSAVRSVRPDVLVNAAAYTAVDRAENEPEVAQAVNAVAPGVLAEEAKRLGALLVHYSTDHVFDGKKESPYVEDDKPNPLNVYGHTKLEGERAIQAAGCRHLIFRTSWIYGTRGRNFLLTVLGLVKERNELRVVDDQIGAPTTAAMVAEASYRIVSGSTEATGLYHLTAAGKISWYGFAQAILRGAGVDTRAVPIKSTEYSAPAKRPANSLLDNSKLERNLKLRLPAWEVGLADTIDVLTREKPHWGSTRP